ncbi:hypothetical protein [Mycobacterium sp.]|uniref:hypothetical protein n=1 Tax=Mycobacterium sp. TaxID=1785 RepID=UPI003F975661
MARPQVSPAATSTDRLRRLAGLLARLRGAAGRARPDRLREVAFDLLIRAPERATVLLAMVTRLVASTSHSPSATRVTTACQFGHRRDPAWRNGRTHSSGTHSDHSEGRQGPLRHLRRHLDGRFVATWSQNVACFDRPARFLAAFLEDSKTTPASRSLTVDILLFFLAAAVLADTLALAAFAIAVAARTIRVDAG